MYELWYLYDDVVEHLCFLIIELGQYTSSPLFPLQNKHFTHNLFDYFAEIF